MKTQLELVKNSDPTMSWEKIYVLDEHGTVQKSIHIKKRVSNVLEVRDFNASESTESERQRALRNLVGGADYDKWSEHNNE